MSNTPRCSASRRAARCALLFALVLAPTGGLLAQAITAQEARNQIADVERQLEAVQAEIDFWEKVTLDRDLFVLPVESAPISMVVPVRRAEVVEYFAHEIATDRWTGNRHNFASEVSRVLELQSRSDALKAAIRDDLLGGLYGSRFELLERRNLLENALASLPVPWPGRPAATVELAAPPVQGLGDGWIFDRVIVDPNRQGPRGEQVLAHEANAAGGSVTMRWQPRADCSEDWLMSWRFDDPVDFVRAGMRIPVRMHIELLGAGCNYRQASYVDLGQQNWEPYLTAEVAVERIAAGAFEWTSQRLAADSTMPVPANDGSAEIIVRQQPPEGGQWSAIFRVFSYVPGFNFTTIYVFRGN